MSAQPEQAARETRWVDPRDLVTRANVRTVAEPDPELVASITANGIIQPPIVYADGADLVLIAGHRRTAAIAAGLERIEVVVGPHLDEQGRLAAQVSENTNRAGLRAVEEVSERRRADGPARSPAGQIAKAARACQGPGRSRPARGCGEQGGQGSHHRGPRADPGPGRRTDLLG